MFAFEWNRDGSHLHICHKQCFSKNKNISFVHTQKKNKLSLHKCLVPLSLQGKKMLRPYEKCLVSSFLLHLSCLTHIVCTGLIKVFKRKKANNHRNTFIKIIFSPVNCYFSVQETFHLQHKPYVQHPHKLHPTCNCLESLSRVSK